MCECECGQLTGATDFSRCSFGLSIRHFRCRLQLLFLLLLLLLLLHAPLHFWPFHLRHFLGVLPYRAAEHGRCVLLFRCGGTIKLS